MFLTGAMARYVFDCRYGLWRYLLLLLWPDEISLIVAMARGDVFDHCYGWLKEMSLTVAMAGGDVFDCCECQRRWP